MGKRLRHSTEPLQTSFGKYAQRLGAATSSFDFLLYTLTLSNKKNTKMASNINYTIVNPDTDAYSLSAQTGVCVIPSGNASCQIQPLTSGTGVPLTVSGSLDISKPAALFIAANFNNNTKYYTSWEIVQFKTLPFSATPNTVSILLTNGQLNQCVANITYSYNAYIKMLQMSILMTFYNPWTNVPTLAHAETSLASISKAAANNQCTVVDTDTHTITICKK
jgi:hypothetical protein